TDHQPQQYIATLPLGATTLLHKHAFSTDRGAESMPGVCTVDAHPIKQRSIATQGCDRARVRYREGLSKLEMWLACSNNTWLRLRDFLPMVWIRLQCGRPSGSNTGGSAAGTNGARHGSTHIPFARPQASASWLSFHTSGRLRGAGLDRRAHAS